jgi:Bacterial Ig-like domain
VAAIVSDAPGNRLVQATQMFVVHETLPTVTISALAADGDNVINHAEAQAGVTLSGSVAGLAAGATFAISVADGSFTHSYTATVNAQGTGWTATIPPTDATTLKDGTLTVTAQVTDQFGNESVQATQTFTVHELPTVTISAQDGDGDNVITHAEAQGGVTLSGSVTGLAAGTTFNITVADGTFTHSYTATVNAQGTGWTATIPPTDATTLKDGTLTVTAQVTDQFGNQSEQATQAFAVDETLPTVTISGISPDTGSSVSDGITNVAVVTVSGTTKANSTVKLFDDGNQAGTAIADSTGHWSVTNVALSEGVNDLTATATDAAGNVSAVSASFVATLDQDTGEHLPVNFNGLTGGHAVEDQTITAVVTDTDNDVPTSGITYTWQISHDGGNTWSTVGANTPTYTPGEDDEGGLLKVLASFTDAAGNTESGSSTVGVLPLLTIANNSLLVSPNGSVSLGISLTQEPTPDDTVSVTISFPSSGAHDPTVAAGDHATGNNHTSGGITTYTFSAADVNSGLTFTNHGDPVDTLTVQEILNGNIIATSQTIMVTDPPVSGGGTIVSEQPASATGEDTPVQSTSANNHVIVGSPLTEMLSGNGDSSAFLFKTNLDHITDPEINFAQNNANTLLHLPAQLDDTGVHTVTDGAHRSHPHFDVTQLASFKVADGGSTHPITVVPHDSPILTALLSDSSGTHGPAAPDLAKTFSVPGTVMSDGASDKFIFAENVDHDMVAGHKPDMTELDHTVPADIQHLLDAAHDTNAVSTLDPNHATAPQDMTTVQLPHHHGDFHFA